MTCVSRKITKPSCRKILHDFRCEPTTLIRPHVSFQNNEAILRNIACHVGCTPKTLMRSILAALEGKAAAPAGAPVATGAGRLAAAPLAGCRRLRGTAAIFAVIALCQGHCQRRQGPRPVRCEREVVCDRIDADATLLRQQ